MRGDMMRVYGVEGGGLEVPRRYTTESLRGRPGCVGEARWAGEAAPSQCLEPQWRPTSKDLQ